MLEDTFVPMGYCAKCGKYAPLNCFKLCRSCVCVNKLMKKAKDLKPVRKNRSGFGSGNWSTG